MLRHSCAVAVGAVATGGGEQCLAYNRHAGAATSGVLPPTLAADAQHYAIAARTVRNYARHSTGAPYHQRILFIRRFQRWRR